MKNYEIHFPGYKLISYIRVRSPYVTMMLHNRMLIIGIPTRKVNPLTPERTQVSPFTEISILF